MATLASVREGIAAALRVGVTVPSDLEVYPRMKASPHMPCLMVTGLDEVEFHVTSGSADSRWRFLLLGICPGGLGDEESQLVLDQWLTDEAGGVMRALEDDPTLGGIADDLIVRSSDGYGFYVVGGVERLGTSWMVDIYT